MDSLGPISSDETIGRRIFSVTKARRAMRGNIAKSIFLEKAGVIQLSTDRTIRARLQDITAIAERSARDRGETFFGWASLPVSKAAMDSRKVKESPTTDNPYHADIVLPANAAKNKDKQKEHAQLLSDAAKWLAPTN